MVALMAQVALAAVARVVLPLLLAQQIQVAAVVEQGVPQAHQHQLVLTAVLVWLLFPSQLLVRHLLLQVHLP
jgi:hypothetical protein